MSTERACARAQGPPPTSLEQGAPTKERVIKKSQKAEDKKTMTKKCYFGLFSK
jgi:hypothetical protein